MTDEYANMPENIKSTLDMYVEHGYEPGGFIMAVLSNDLMGAFAKADSECIANMHTIIKYVYNRTPNGCHGSTQNVYDWIALKRAERL